MRLGGIAGSTVSSIIRRHELLNPATLEWEWRAWEVPPYLQKPRYVRLADGRWMQVQQVEGDLVMGQIIPWEAFSLMMANQRARYRREHIQYKAVAFIVCVCIFGLIAGFRIFQAQQFLGAVIIIIAGFVLLGSLQEAITRGMALRLFAIHDPGPNIAVRPIDLVRDQTLHGTGGFVPAGDAVRNIGPQPWSRGGQSGRRLGN